MSDHHDTPEDLAKTAEDGITLTEFELNNITGGSKAGQDTSFTFTKIELDNKSTP